MDLSVITAASAAQLRLWHMLSPPLTPAVCFFSFPDILDLLMPEGTLIYDRELHLFILGYLGLFSSCKSIRAHVALLIAAVKKMFIRWYVKPLSPFCWDLMEGLHVGEFMLLLRNYYEQGPIRRVHFLNLLPGVVSVNPPQDLNRPIQGSVVYLMSSWTPPLSPVVRAFAEMLLRYQADGDISEFHEFGFFSSYINRHCFQKMVTIIEVTEYGDGWVRCKHRLEMLRLLIEHSFAVIDLTRTPLLQGAEAEPNVDSDISQYLPRITGVHVGVNPADIAQLNEHSEGRGPKISFRLFDV